MNLAERLRTALIHNHDPETILLDGDMRAAAFEEDSALMPAAVLVPVTDRAEPGVLLTVRSAAMRRHASQVAFPGGKIDPEDDGPIGAALREAEEEIGLPASAVDVIGVFDRYVTITGFDVTPVIAVVPPDLVLIPHDIEVAKVFEAPLSFILDPANHVEQVIAYEGRDRIYYEIVWEGHRIWGATAAMIINISRRIAGRL
jgi:8-oxo-dGTP pyrophosphatase MutT (NUDIX family)